MPRELQVADDAGIEERHRVRGHRVAKSRVKFLRYGGAADDVPALEHAHTQARGRQIGRAGEPVVASADDEDVAIAHGFAVMVWKRRPARVAGYRQQCRPPRTPLILRKFWARSRALREI